MVRTGLGSSMLEARRSLGYREFFDAFAGSRADLNMLTASLTKRPSSSVVLSDQCKKRRKQTTPVRISTTDSADGEGGCNNGGGGGGVGDGGGGNAGNGAGNNGWDPAEWLQSAPVFLPPFPGPQSLLTQPPTTRIFNPDAFCDLCNKEFCNKYFLKTHKANKHRIYTDGHPAPGEATETLPPQPVTIKLETYPDQPECKEESELNLDSDSVERVRVPNPDAFCEICCKEYCNKYFLRTHKLKRHGILVQMDEPSKEGGPPGWCQTQTSPLNLIMAEQNTSSSNSGSGEVDCADCTDPNLRPGSADISEDLQKLQTMILQLSDLGMAGLPGVAGGVAPVPLVKTSGGSTPPDPDPTDKPEEQGPRNAAPASSYCDICNKELCNKYFMKTHMQRMHGIEIENGSQIGGVVCDICNKELCSKYFLRVHKHNTHGVPAATTDEAEAEEARRPAGAPTNGLGNFKWVRAATEALRVPQPTQGDHQPQQPAKQQHYRCGQCPFSTPALALLFVHERSHPARPDLQALARRAQLPASYALPQLAASYHMQAFLMDEPGRSYFVPSVVFLPVVEKLTVPLTVSFTLTPA